MSAVLRRVNALSTGSEISLRSLMLHVFTQSVSCSVGTAGRGRKE